MNKIVFLTLLVLFFTFDFKVSAATDVSLIEIPDSLNNFQTASSTIDLNSGSNIQIPSVNHSDSTSTLLNFMGIMIAVIGVLGTLTLGIGALIIYIGINEKKEAKKTLEEITIMKKEATKLFSSAVSNSNSAVEIAISNAEKLTKLLNHAVDYVKSVSDQTEESKAKIQKFEKEASELLNDLSSKSQEQRAMNASIKQIELKRKAIAEAIRRLASEKKDSE